MVLKYKGSNLDVMCIVFWTILLKISSSSFSYWMGNIKKLQQYIMPTQRFSLAKSLRHERRHRALICLVLVWAGVWVTPATFDDHHSCSSGQSTRKGDSIIGHFSGGFSKKISSKDYLSLCHFQFQNLVKTFCICFYFVCLSLILLHLSLRFVLSVTADYLFILLRNKNNGSLMAVPLTRKDSQ